MIPFGHITKPLSLIMQIVRFGLCETSDVPGMELDGVYRTFRENLVNSLLTASLSFKFHEKWNTPCELESEQRQTGGGSLVAHYRNKRIFVTSFLSPELPFSFELYA